MADNFEIFHVKYRLPKFGTDNEFQDEPHLFIVSTKEGRNDAIKACKQFHKGCKVESVHSYIEVAEELDKIPTIKKEKKTKKSKK